MYPSSKVLWTIQHRATEKEAVISSGNKTVEFERDISSQDALWKAFEKYWPWIIKTAREWYDGKWQFRVNSPEDISAFIQLVRDGKEKPFWEIDRIYEQLVDFDYEIAVTIARNPRGETMIFEPSHNTHKNGILDTSFIPAIHSIPLQGKINQDVVDRSKQIAESVATSMDIVWEVTIEMFVTKDGDILVNELAPRPHNSAHWTIESYDISQYHALVMAILDEDLWENTLTSGTYLKNMMGNDISFIPGRLSWDWYSHTFFDSGIPTSYYDYGKWKWVEDGNFPEWRKMGHMTKMVSIKK